MLTSVQSPEPEKARLQKEGRKKKTDGRKGKELGAEREVERGRATENQRRGGVQPCKGVKTQPHRALDLTQPCSERNKSTAGLKQPHHAASCLTEACVRACTHTLTPGTRWPLA